MSFLPTHSCRTQLFAVSRSLAKSRDGFLYSFRKLIQKSLGDAMRGMRNRMIHGYDDIDFNIVWNTVQESIPLLLILIEPLQESDLG